MRYYENMRLVYEIESRVRDLRRAGTPDQKASDNKQQPQQEAPAPNQKNPSKSDNRHGTEQQNYSRDNGEPTGRVSGCDVGSHPQARRPKRLSSLAENRRTA